MPVRCWYICRVLGVNILPVQVWVRGAERPAVEAGACEQRDPRVADRADLVVADRQVLPGAHKGRPVGDIEIALLDLDEAHELVDGAVTAAERELARLGLLDRHDMVTATAWAAQHVAAGRHFGRALCADQRATVAARAPAAIVTAIVTGIGIVTGMTTIAMPALIDFCAVLAAIHI